MLTNYERISVYIYILKKIIIISFNNSINNTWREKKCKIQIIKKWSFPVFKWMQTSKNTIQINLTNILEE